MSVLETDLVDYIYLDEDEATPVLVVSDPLTWRPPEDATHLDALRDRFRNTAAWSAAEQAGVAGAGDGVLHALADGNRLYEVKFGYTFIVCATGKTAAEMLALLQQRLENDPEQELPIAAAEQAKITRLRLQKLCS